MTQQPTTTDATARKLLACGVVGAPLFVVVGLIQAYTRTGFDLERHPFSLLSLGDLGWIQIANFVVSGLLFIACAGGLRRVLRAGPGRVAGPLLYAGVGVGLVAGGVFVADPAFGFGPNAPAGQPAQVSTAGVLHGIAFAVGMLSLVAAFFVFSRRYAALGQRPWALYSLATGVAFLILSAVGMGTGDFRIVTVAVVIGWGWASVVAAHHLMNGAAR